MPSKRAWDPKNTLIEGKGCEKLSVTEVVDSWAMLSICTCVYTHTHTPHVCSDSAVNHQHRVLLWMQVSTPQFGSFCPSLSPDAEALYPLLDPFTRVTSE